MGLGALDLGCALVPCGHVGGHWIGDGVQPLCVVSQTVPTRCRFSSVVAGGPLGMARLLPALDRPRGMGGETPLHPVGRCAARVVLDHGAFGTRSSATVGVGQRGNRTDHLAGVGRVAAAARRSPRRTRLDAMDVPHSTRHVRRLGCGVGISRDPTRLGVGVPGTVGNLHGRDGILHKRAPVAAVAVVVDGSGGLSPNEAHPHRRRSRIRNRGTWRGGMVAPTHSRGQGIPAHPHRPWPSLHPSP